MRVRRHVASATTVVLLGDSHAAQWFPTLRRLAAEERLAPARAHQVRLPGARRDDPPAPALARRTTSATPGARRCSTSWCARKPALVVAAGTRTDSLVDRGDGRPGRVVGGGRRVEGRVAAHPRAAREGGRHRRGAARHPVAGQGHGRVRATATGPNPSACDVSRDALDSPAYDVGTASGSPTAHGVDLSDVICDADRCPATRGKYLVYRDTDHLTATFARALAPYLERAARAAPALKPVAGPRVRCGRSRAAGSRRP